MKQLSEMSVEELNQQQRSMKFVTGIMIGLFIGMGAVSIFLTFQKGFTVFTMLPVFFLALALAISNKLKKYKQNYAYGANTKNRVYYL